MPMWLVWLVAAGALGIAELLSLSLVLGMLAGAALVAAVVAGLGGPLVLQLVAFAASALALLLVVRPIAGSHLRQPGRTRTGVDALIGAEAVVVQAITRSTGQIRLGGEIWSARSYDPDVVVPVGATVDVMAIEGATALVYAPGLTGMPDLPLPPSGGGGDHPSPGEDS